MPLRALAWQSQLAGLLLLPLAALAEVKVEVTPGLHGLVRAHRWGFVSVVLTNDGEETSGEVHLQLPGDTYVYKRKVDLPSKKRARVNMYFRMRELQTEVTVTWVDAKGGGKKLPPVPFLGGSRDPYYLAAVWTSRPNVQDLGLASFVNHPILGTDELPDHWKGYDALDILVVDAPEVSSMTPSQSKALLQWIECGGRVLVVGEATWTPNGIDPFLAQLLPCTVTGETVNNLTWTTPGLKSKTPIPSVLKVSLHTRAFVSIYHTAEQDDVPLWIREARGCGMVEFLPFHPRVLSSSYPNNKPGPFWGRNLTDQQRDAVPSGFTDRNPTEDFLPVLLEPAQSPEGPIGTVTLFAIVYAVLVGPGVFWFQRRYRNVFTRALTFPAVVAGFAVLAFLLNAALKQRELGSVRLTLVYGTQDGKGVRGTTYLSFISPHEGEFQITSQRDGAVFSILPRREAGVRTSEIEIVEGATHQVSLSVRPWVSETYVCEWKGDVDTGIVSHLAWARDAASNWVLQGSIENTASEPLVHCRLVARRKASNGFEIAKKGSCTAPFLGNVLSGQSENYYRSLTSSNLITDPTDGGNKLSASAGQGPRRAEVVQMANTYAFYAMLFGCEVPFPDKSGGTMGFMDPLVDREIDCETLSIKPIVEHESPEVILIGWRQEDVSRVDFAGQKPAGEEWTMYVVRLEVAGGR